MAVALLLVVAAPVVAQERACADCAARADSAFFQQGDVAGSLSIALEGLAEDSSDAALWRRASRAELTLGITMPVESELTDAHYRMATEHARRAVALTPNDADAHFWLAAALGRRALRAGFRSSMALAAEAFTESAEALAIDSLHAGAHDVMGKLHSEVRKLPWVVRSMAAAFTGFELAKTASWEAAEHHLKRSIALDPAYLVARADLAELYLRMGRADLALKTVEELDGMPRRAPADATFQRIARSRMEEALEHLGGDIGR